MQKLFNNVLLPVQLDNRTDAAVENAVAFANRFRCHLHLVYVRPLRGIGWIGSRFFSWSGGKVISPEKKIRLQQLQKEYCTFLAPGLLLHTAMEKGEPEDLIAQYVLTHEIDIVLSIDDQGRAAGIFKKCNASRLAGKTNSAVLTLRSTEGLQELKNIVLPIGKALPISKIRVAAYLARHFNAAIHLITTKKKNLLTDEMGYMKKAFQVLKDNTNLPVHCKTISGESLGDISLEYGSSVPAGLIIVNPGAESRLSGVANRFFSKFLFRKSRTPVMTIS